MNKIATLDRKGLRNFGLTTGGMVLVLFAGLIPWLLEQDLPIWPWVVAAALWTLAIMAPYTLGPIYNGWMKFGTVVGALNTRVLLGLIFYVIITPSGFVMRLLGRDPLHRKLDGSSTYRISSKANPPQNMERPF